MSFSNLLRITMERKKKAEAEAMTDFDENSLAKLRLSFDLLSKIEQQIFLDIATFFGGNENWTLRDALVSSTVAYQTDSAGLMWKALVDRSLAYDMILDEHIKVDTQPRSLGRKIASELTNKGKRRVWDKTTALELLQKSCEFKDGQIYSLRLGTQED